jgi:flagellar assembly factor FliW
MRIETERFGCLEADDRQLFLFPQGLIGLETLRQWLLIPDFENPLVAWLQSASRGDRALALISPRLFVPGYRVHIPRQGLDAIQLRGEDRVYVLTTLSGKPDQVTTNLRAPVIINLDKRLGCQVVTGDDQPVQFVLPSKAGALSSKAA